ncbi:MAG: glycosyltransferase [Alphaproteobacteria bacterium]|nr:glycosyltransferase [Alphaproteobacteria bacterium]MBV9377668.1 glycosyltransferase [Alphaproteobacteria bacterium]
MPKLVLFCQSLRSDWNNGNAHFLRGVLSECWHRGFDVLALEPSDNWSAANLGRDHGPDALAAWREAYPVLPLAVYDPTALDLDQVLEGVDIVLVHEWNTPELLARIGAHRNSGGSYLLLFHDTHHRAVSDPAAMDALDLSAFDGVLAFGDILREAYIRRGWARRAFTWHEAADLQVFTPRPEIERQRDLVWIGNWGDEERTAELREYLIEPIALLDLSARVHGVRYPDEAHRALAQAGIDFAGYLPNFRVPDAFAEAAATVHIPRRPYVHFLPGIPTIRVFEALACGIPLVCSPWEDTEGLFKPGEDFLMARSSIEMQGHLNAILHDTNLASELSRRGRATVEARHSCGHRVDELLAICRALGRDLVRPHTAAAQ